MKVRLKNGRIGEHRLVWDNNPMGIAPLLIGSETVELDITERIYDGPDCYPWRKTFALWPVKTIGGQRIWLRTVYKQRFWAVWGKGFHMEPWVEYATLFEILKDESKSPK